MNLKLVSLALLTACATAVTAQTPHPPASTTHHTAATAAQTATPPNIPKVAGVPKILYAIRYIDTKIGAGALAEQRKYYTVHYTGWLTDGTKFDSSYDHPGAEPITFPYGAHQVITGWDTGFEGMHIGGKRRLFIPYQLAYGEAGRPGIPGKTDLIFDLELVAQSDTPPEQKPAIAAPTATSKPAETAPDTNAKPPADSSPSTPAGQPASPPHPENL